MGIYFPKVYMLMRIIINNIWVYAGYQNRWGYNNLVKSLTSAYLYALLPIVYFAYLLNEKSYQHQ